MSFGSFVVLAVIFTLLFLAVRHLVKKGPCSVCGNAENCHSCHGCQGGCSHCQSKHPAGTSSYGTKGQ